MTITYFRGLTPHATPLAALTAPTPYAPITARQGGALLTADAHRAALDHLTQCPDTPEIAVTAAYHRAQLASLTEIPTKPPFDVTFPSIAEGQHGELDALTVMRAELGHTLYLPSHHAYPGLPSLHDALRRPWQALHVWTPEAGYGHHCAGYRQSSVRPYRPTDRCDGTRDLAALYLTRFYLHRIGMGASEWNALYLRAYEHDAPPAPVLWFSATWRAHEIHTAPLPTKATYEALLASLYDMNHRSLSAELEPYTWRFP